MFQDGTYKDAESYIVTTLAYCKMIVDANNQKNVIKEKSPIKIAEELVKKLNEMYDIEFSESQTYTHPFEAYYDGDSDMLGIRLKMLDEIWI